MFRTKTIFDRITDFVFGLIPWVCLLGLVIGICGFLNIVGNIPIPIIIGLIILTVVMVIGIRKVIKQYLVEFGDKD